MSTQQTGFDRFTAPTETTDLWDFDDYGPTMDEPLPDAELELVIGPNGVDKRELPGTGLEPFAVTTLSNKIGWKIARDYHPDDETRHDRLEEEAERLADTMETSIVRKT